MIAWGHCPDPQERRSVLMHCCRPHPSKQHPAQFTESAELWQSRAGQFSINNCPFASPGHHLLSRTDAQAEYNQGLLLNKRIRIDSENRPSARSTAMVFANEAYFNDRAGVMQHGGAE